ncbi:MAG TPA: glycosyltransferase family 1 protein, partial [Roseiflexaceae bacterium]|nr:glycosyltransferase family 1 protein [Roseiflexaceae bacterium]
MHIAINGMFWNEPLVGSGQYLHGLLAGLLRSAPQHRYTLLVPQGHTAVAAPIEVVEVATPFGERRGPAKLWFEQVGVVQAAQRVAADLLHVPYFAPPLHASVPVVVTILDLIPLLLPEYRGRPAVRAYMRLVAAAAPRADRILAISEAARHDIMIHLGVAAERIITTPLAAGAHYRPVADAGATVAARYGIEAPFIYYVGGLDARKNLATLIAAFARLRQAGGPPATLVIAGRARGSDPLLFPDVDALLADAGVADGVRRIDVPYNDSALLYSAATVFAFPSRYEGFGLPPLEAMACGTPCVGA